MPKTTATGPQIVANGAPAVETGLPLADALDDWAAYLDGEVSKLRKSGATRAIYVTGAERFVRFATDAGMPPTVEGIRREHIEAFLEHLAVTGSKAATMDTYRRAVSRWFAFLVDDDVIEKADNPTQNVKAIPIPETPPPILSPEQIRAILAACKGRDFESRRDTALVWLLLCGLRRGEIAGLKVGDVYRRERHVIVTGKGNRTRVVPFLDPEVGNVLRRYEHARKTHHARASETYIVGWKGPLTGDGIRQTVERRAQQAGVQGVFSHQFRHTFAHTAKRAGMSDEDIMAIGGWRNHASLTRYGASARTERARAAADRLSVYRDL